MKPPISSGSPSSSTSWALAENASARKPIFSDSPRATTPRITGRRRIRWRFAHETSGSEVTSISPSGLRTATAQVETPRIITPSSTAWPPTGASREATGMPSGMRSREFRAWPERRRRPCSCQESASSCVRGSAALEALDPAAGVDELLLAGVERMARQSRCRRASRPSSSGCRSRSRTSNARGRGRIRGGSRSSSSFDSS